MTGVDIYGRCRALQAELKAFEQTPEATGLDLRLDFAEIVLRRLNGKPWTHYGLATACGISRARLSRIINSACDCTLDEVGRVLHVLGIKAKLTVLDNPVAVGIIEQPQEERNGDF